MGELSRRGLLGGAAAAAAASQAWSAPAAPPIIDCHIHLYDTTRTHGVPYPEPGGARPMPPVSSPALYAAQARRHGVVGAIMVEASPWIEDNLWALELAESDPLMVGVIGNLQPEKPDFAEQLERYRRHPLFRGIRYATLWGYDLPAQVSNPVFVQGLRRMADAGLVLETNGGLRLIQAALRVSDQVPDLRIVVDHVAAAGPPGGDAAALAQALREVGQRPNIFGKISEVIGARAPSPEVAAHKGRLDELFGLFGEDRVLFGSDWPNTVRSGVDIHQVFGLMRAYMAGRSVAEQEKFFWRNSARAYRWVRRTPAQPAA